MGDKSSESSNGTCRSFKCTVSQIGKWIISKERLNIPIPSGSTMTDDERLPPKKTIHLNLHTWRVFFKRFGISHGMCDCGLRLRYVHRGTIEFHFVGWLDISWAGSRWKSSAGVWLFLGEKKTQQGKPLMEKGSFFTEFFHGVWNRPPSKSPEKPVYIRR